MTRKGARVKPPGGHSSKCVSFFITHISFMIRTIAPAHGKHENRGAQQRQRGKFKNVDIRPATRHQPATQEWPDDRADASDAERPTDACGTHRRWIEYHRQGVDAFLSAAHGKSRAEDDGNDGGERGGQESNQGYK